MPDPYGQHQQGCDPGAEGNGMTAMLGARFLPEDDVQRPANPGAERQRRAAGVDGMLRGPGWQQHPQTGYGQNDPDEIQQAARRKQRQGQRAGELEGDGNAEGNALQRHVEHQVHATQRQAIGQQGPALAQVQPCTPGLHHQRQDDCTEHQAQGRGAFGANKREQVLGQGGAALDRNHGHRQQGDGNEKGGAWHELS